MEFMQTDRNNKIEEIIISLDGAKRAEVPDFFYTRLKARMLARHEGSDSIQGRSRILRPVFIVSAVLLVLAINAFVFLKGQNETNTSTADNNESVQQSIAAEYSLNDNNTVYDLNQEK
jgi:ABC-type Na+ efflux pump permease subunit